MRSAKSPEERNRLLRDPAYRQAAQYAPGELSGLGEAHRKALIEEDARARFPHLAELDEQDKAVEFMRGVLRSVSSAVDAELSAIGAPTKQPDPVKPPAPWVR